MMLPLPARVAFAIAKQTSSLIYSMNRDDELQLATLIVYETKGWEDAVPRQRWVDLVLKVLTEDILIHVSETVVNRIIDATMLDVEDWQFNEQMF